MCHGIQGFDDEKTRIVLEVPNNFDVMAMIAVGKRGPKDILPKNYSKEIPNDRKPLSEIVIEG